MLAGFENHGGRTHLGAGAQPLGRVLHGHGNNGEDRHEGSREGKVIGTYLHGPLLPKNAWFADWLIATALGDGVVLEPLDDELEEFGACRCPQGGRLVSGRRTIAGLAVALILSAGLIAGLGAGTASAGHAGATGTTTATVPTQPAVTTVATPTTPAAGLPGYNQAPRCCLAT